jgi:5'-phosphate synthase pdxT subunit
MVATPRRTVGILGYQGCIEPHEAMFNALGVAHRRVRTPEDLGSVDRLILPGGESTTMLRFLKLHSMIEPIRAFARSNPVWGICAGAILAASEVVHPSQDSLAIIDITAHRNFYGSQLDSFTTQLSIDFLERPIEAHFIRAPLLSPRAGLNREGAAAQATAHYGQQPVFFTQGNVWACSFHVELGQDTALHEHFAQL